MVDWGKQKYFPFKLIVNVCDCFSPLMSVAGKLRAEVYEEAGNW